ncbi:MULTISPECIES: PrgI family protein [Streptomyces]|uniref:PrgI family protein n=3 Tax=Streptomyces TaxID=1883 RepID=A0ABD5JFM9_9ACTN|nr:PrgI family protein [Streptomyces sp. WAC05858]MEE4586392.1 PrgI family protein [Streptomyces sp. DSM 41602]QTI90229.1 PrgI family protein [Streptomyces sp. AgN23]RSS37779.1 PrgI family protein [Streptomyces sp. WAC05858]
MTDGYDDGVATTRIPADIARPDRVLGPLTARQTAILAGCVLVLYGGYWLARPFMPLLAYLVMVVPVAGAVTAVAVGAREGIGLDRCWSLWVRRRLRCTLVPSRSGVIWLPPWS